MTATGPWHVEFRRPDGTVLTSALAVDRSRAIAHIEAQWPRMRDEVVGEWTVTLRGPNGEVLEGDAALEGATLTRRFVEPGDGSVHEVPPWEQEEQKANELVARFILRTYREPHQADNQHLKECPDITVDDPDAYDGTYACDTGCEYVRFEALITCPHGEREAFKWGDFGRLSSILEEMSEMEER